MCVSLSCGTRAVCIKIGGGSTAGCPLCPKRFHPRLLRAPALLCIILIIPCLPANFTRTHRAPAVQNSHYSVTPGLRIQNIVPKRVKDRRRPEYTECKQANSFPSFVRSIRLSESEEMAKGLLEPGSWLVQGTLGLAYPGSYESHVCLAEWYVGNTSCVVCFLN